APLGTFAYVKSSAITPRQPSVPNLMAISEALELWGLDKAIQPLVLEPFHDFAHVLRTLARTKQQRVLGFHEKQIVHADGGDEFLWTPEKVALRVERKGRARRHIRAWFCGEQLVNCGPRTDVAPSNVRGYDQDPRLSAIARRRLHDRVINGNILELWIHAAERRCISSR